MWGSLTLVPIFLIAHMVLHRMQETINRNIAASRQIEVARSSTAITATVTEWGLCSQESHRAMQVPLMRENPSRHVVLLVVLELKVVFRLEPGNEKYN